MLDTLKFVWQSWLEALSIFHPKNLKIFILLSLKNYFYTLRSYLVYIVGLLILVAGLNVLASYFSTNPYIVNWILILASFFIGSVWFILLRASIEKKNISYVISKLKYFLPLLLVFVVASFISIIVEYGLLYIALRYINRSLVPYFFAMTFSSYFIYTLQIIWIFFILDRPLKIKEFFKSALNTLKMFVLNLPVLVALIVTFTILQYLFLLMTTHLVHWINIENSAPYLYNYTSLMISLAISPISSAFVYFIYVKNLHQKFYLYYKS